MPIHFSDAVYLVCQDTFSISVTVHPVFSQPDGASYEARGIFNREDLDVMAEDGSIFSDHKTILDIRTLEYPILPQQKDRIDIPFDCNGEPLGSFEVIDTELNGGGEMTLTLRKWEPPRP